MSTQKDKFKALIAGNIGNLSTQTEALKETELEVESKKKDKQIAFSFNMEVETIEYFRVLEFYKRRLNPKYFLTNISELVREGIALVRSNSPQITARPSSVPISTKRGFREKLAGKEYKKTSYRISKSDKEFIYDYIYYRRFKVQEEFGKTEFMTEVMKQLKKKYPTAEENI